MLSWTQLRCLHQTFSHLSCFSLKSFSSSPSSPSPHWHGQRTSELVAGAAMVVLWQWHICRCSDKQLSLIMGLTPARETLTCWPMWTRQICWEEKLERWGWDKFFIQDPNSDPISQKVEAQLHPVHSTAFQQITLLFGGITNSTTSQIAICLKGLYSLRSKDFHLNKGQLAEKSCVYRIDQQKNYSY